MAIEVFNRKEYKYILNNEQYLYMTEFLKKYMVSDPYNIDGNPYTISNIYFDTEHNELISRSIEKPIYKEKLRLRGYGVPSVDDKVFLEIKKKYKGIVNKRRTPLMLHEAYDFVENGGPYEVKSYMNPQVVNELKYFLKMNKVFPKVYLAYDRIAFFGENNHDLRVSFDTNIRTRRDNLRLESGDHGTLILPEGTWIMEIKDLYSMPLWLANELSRRELYRQSFSKYGTEFKNYIKEKTQQCLTFY